jgi:hypothetical protein
MDCWLSCLQELPHSLFHYSLFQIFCIESTLQAIAPLQHAMIGSAALICGSKNHSVMVKLYESNLKILPDITAT